MLLAVPLAVPVVGEKVCGKAQYEHCKLNLSTYTLPVTSRKVSSSSQTVVFAERAAETKSGFLFYF